MAERQATGTKPAHALPAAEVLTRFGTALREGLTDAEAQRRRARFGPNMIPAKERAGAFTLLLHQLASPVVYLLAAAGGLSLYYFGDWREAAAVMAVLVVNTGVGFFTPSCGRPDPSRGCGRSERARPAFVATGTHGCLPPRISSRAISCWSRVVMPSRPTSGWSRRPT